MIYKLTSVERVISKVFTDLDLKEGDHRISDMVEYAGEALEKIGAFPSFTNKVTGRDDVPILQIVNYQSQLPPDFHSVIQVSFSPTIDGPYYPMRYGTGSFDYGKVTNETSAIPTTYGDSDLVVLAMSLYSMDYVEALNKINNEPLTKANLSAMLAQMVSKSNTSSTSTVDPPVVGYTYLITSNYIKTNVESGFIMMAYQAIPTDSKGYPMIPDDSSFIDAIYWYITMKLYYPKWVAGQIRDSVYYDARRSWNYYCKQAYGNALMPNVDLMESIKNSWNRLVPELNEHATGFSTLGQEQYIYNKHI
jgi:hypothetical protein